MTLTQFLDMDGKQVFDKAVKTQIAEFIASNSDNIIAEINNGITSSDKSNKKDKKQNATTTSKKKKQ